MKRSLYLSSETGRQRLQYALTVFIASGFVLVFYQYVLNLPTVHNRYIFTLQEDLLQTQQLHLTPAPPKTILQWTSFFGHWDNFPPDWSDLNCLEGEMQPCLLTNDRDYYSYADALLFHARDAELYDLPTAKLPNSSQLWVMYNYESPSHVSRGLIHELSPHIDMTVSYRIDSDIYSPYGRLRPRNDKDQVVEPVKWELTPLDQPVVVWLVSHCATPGKREDFVQDFENHIQVEVLGSCGIPAKICSNNESRLICYKKLAQRYKFYLSFENSLCTDYVTEKFFLALQSGMVPITLGGADYTIIAPKGSYINAMDYDSPQHLAEYVLKVSRNESLYKSYFEWRKDYVVDFADFDKINSKRWLCTLCSRLHNRKPLLKRRDLAYWWFNEGKCWSWSKISTKSAIAALNTIGAKLKKALTGPIVTMFSHTKATFK